MEDIYGTDIDSSWSIGVNGDFNLVSGVDNAKQAILNRLLTKPDELFFFNYDNYNGNLAYNALGKTDIQDAQSEIKVDTNVCLMEEPRVLTVDNLEVNYLNKIITCKVNVGLVDETNALNLVFSIES